MRITRRAGALVGIVMFWLFVLFGSGLIGDRTILLLAIGGFVLPAILCAWLAWMWEPGGLMGKRFAAAPVVANEKERRTR